MLTPSSAHAVRKEGRKVHVHWDFTWFAVTTYFVANYVEFCKKKKHAILRGLPDLLQYYISRGIT